MPADLEKLDKILRLERSQGYRDRAVIGGLASFAQRWQAEAEAGIEESAQRDQVLEISKLLSSYSEANTSQRAQIIDEILRGIDPQSSRAVHVRKPAEEKPPLPGAESKARDQRMATEPLDSDSRNHIVERYASGLEAPVSSLPGISAAYTARLQRLGIETVGDLLYHIPHRYDDYRTLKPINRLEYGEETTIIGTIWDTETRPTRGGGKIISTIVADASGTIEAVWFNQPFLARQLRPGRQIVLSGKVDEHLGRLTLQSPAWEPIEKELIHTGRLVPIYPLTSGVTSRWMRRMIKRVLDYWAPRLEDHLPAASRSRANLIDLPTALRQIHFPESQEAAERARHRLAFDEFLFIQLGMLHYRRQRQSQPTSPIPPAPAQLQAFLQSLPFQLTEAQRQSLNQILEDLARDQPMGRLLQGDVGSGKTVVATAAMVVAAASGKQSALMAPTEILAEQHYRTVSAMLAGTAQVGSQRPLSVVLLTGSLGRVERGKVYSALASGQADIVIGTHALIQKHVTFHDLGLVIVDEQHRFGVLQRSMLREKGASPHVLVMSATPIPRSLALTLYGDLDISVIDRLPPGRQPIETRWLLPRERERAYAFLRSQVEKGHQAFILFPLIEESSQVSARAAVEEYERLQQSVFPDLRLGLLHGRLPARDKDQVMTAFRNAEIDILVSTSVVEVGIDVPNATAILIEGADRFGLAQLHQFRGRVGRGGAKSYCLLLSDSASPDDPKTRATWERLKAIEEIQDGFLLAEKDLELRGPGDFVGVRQSGLPTLRLASLSNLQVLQQARAEAHALFEEDPDLKKPEHQALSDRVSKFWQAEGNLS